MTGERLFPQCSAYHPESPARGAVRSGRIREEIAANLLLYTKRCLAKAQFWRALLAGLIPGSPSLADAAKEVSWLALPKKPPGT